MIDTGPLEQQLAALLHKKVSNENAIPREILMSKYKASYARLCAEVHDMQARLNAANLYNAFCGIRQDEDDRWADLVKKIDAFAADENRNIQQYFLDIANALEKEAKEAARGVMLVGNVA